jgi:hypothetical protein
MTGWVPPKASGPAGSLLTGGMIYLQAQQRANRGYVVLAICRNPDPRAPGHVALVLPAELSMDKLVETGPALIMAGTHNHNRITLRAGFKSHLEGWPENSVRFYVNSKPFK